MAALSVVVYHVGVSLDRFHPVASWPHQLSAGVDIFFVISGFIMWTSTRRAGIGPVTFLGHRIRRIVPLYWAVTSFVLLVAVFAPHMMDGAGLNVWHTISSYLFIASEHPGKSHEIAPLLVVGWTLNYEFFFYAIFAIALALRPGLRLAALATAMVAVALLGIGIGEPRSVAGFYTAPIVLEFLMGVGIGYWTEARKPGSARWTAPRTGVALAAIVVATLALFLFPALPGRADWTRLIAFGLPAAAIVAGAVSLEQAGRWPQNRLVHLLGDASYSIYLVHGIVLSAFATAWMKAGLTGLPAAVGLPLFALAAVGFAALGGVLVWRFFERPVDRLLRRTLARRGQTAGGPAQ